MRATAVCAVLHSLLADEEMTLLKRLQDTRAWLAETNGAKHVNPKLTLAELDRVIGALQQIENRVHDPMMPPGTCRTPEEIDALFEKMGMNKRKMLA